MKRVPAAEARTCGTLSANGMALAQGDALKIVGETALVIDGGAAAEVLVFDLPA